MQKRIQTVKEFLELPFDEEHELNNLTFLASEICDTPTASITLVDDINQYPVVGIGNLLYSSCDIAFCNHTIKQKEILEVPNALDDPRFAHNPLVVNNPHIRFYAGVPLITKEGFTIGSFCVIDDRPKKLSEGQIKSLEILAQQAMHRMELVKMMSALRHTVSDLEKNEELLEQAEIMKQAFYDGSEEYFLLLNTKHQVISFNASFSRFIESRKGNLDLKKGQDILKYVRSQNIPIVEEALVKAKKGTTTVFELLADGDNEKKSWTKFMASPIYNGAKELIGIACIGSNIDREKTQQEKINFQTSTLSKISEVHSHEVRQPLTNILGLIQIIKSEGYTLNKQYLQYLEKSAEQLDKIIKKVVLDSYTAK